MEGTGNGMYHILHWQELDPCERPVAAAAEQALMRPGPAEREAALDALAHLTGYRVMTAAQMRGIRAAMAWAGMGDTPESPSAATDRTPLRGSMPPTPSESDGQQTSRRDEETPPGRDRSGEGAGIPLRTLTIPGLTWDVPAAACATALRAWRRALHCWQPHTDLLYDLSGLTSEQRRRTWLSWLAFLAGAEHHQGFHGEASSRPICHGHPYGRAHGG